MSLLRPSEIFYSQDSINNTFDRKSQHSYKYIGETLDDICEGRWVEERYWKITQHRRHLIFNGWSLVTSKQVLSKQMQADFA